MGGGAFSLLKAFLLPFSPCGGNFASFFSVWVGFFHNLKAFFAPFLPSRCFLLRLSPYGGLFSQFESLSATFFSMWGAFLLRFSPYRGLFHYLKALLLRFLLLGGPFHRLTLSDPGYFRQLTIRGGGGGGGGGFRSPPTTISKTIVSIFTISYMCILPGVLGMFQLEFFKNSRF